MDARLGLPLLAALSSLVPGCFVDRFGLALMDGGRGSDGAADAEASCAAGTADLDGDPSNGCECVVMMETCDDTDEDCDGRIDEDVTRPCGMAGTCSAGWQTCAAGAFGECVPLVDPPPEECGGGDEDCDGATDEGCECSPPASSRSCGTSDIGACRLGTQTCRADGRWGPCEGAVHPVAEECNDIDDDCDGTVDGFDRSCGTTVGICTAGIQTCTGGAFGPCSGTPAGDEQCDAARLDEDCDGMANEGCACDEGQTRPCGSGSCAGLETCTLSGAYGACVPARTSPETCDATDEDCDGTIDEGGADCADVTGCDLERIGGGTYLFCHDNTRSWMRARDHCAMFGYHLVTIDDSAEDAALAARADMLSRGDWWIGYADRDGDGTFDWVYMPSSYTNLAMAPSSGECAVLRSDSGDWTTKGCGGDKRFICEAP